MSCKPNISVATTTPVTVAATNGIIPLNTILRRRGNGINKTGNSVTLSDCGSNYYLVNINATFTAPAAGDVTINLQQNGTNVTGGTGTETITTAVTENRTIAFTIIVRTFAGASVDSLSLTNAGVEVLFSNVVMTVTKL